MTLIVMTSLPVADFHISAAATGKLDHQWFEAGSMLQPVPMSTTNVLVVDLGIQQPAVGRQPSRSARFHVNTGVLARRRRRYRVASEGRSVAPRLGDHE